MIKRNITRFILAAQLAALTLSAGIFPPEKGDLAASIPFSFRIGSSVMAAGEYIIRADERGHIELCEDGVYCTTMTTSGSSIQGQNPDLMFAKFGTELKFVGITAGGKKDQDTTTFVSARKLCVHDSKGGLGVNWH